MSPRQIGVKNQKRSKQYMLSKPLKYGVFPITEILKSGKKVLVSDRIHDIKSGHFQEDIFGLFDLISMPESEDGFIYLVQVKSQSFSLSLTANIEYMNTIYEFTVPLNVKKELHIWNNIQNIPKIIEL